MSDTIRVNKDQLKEMFAKFDKSMNTVQSAVLELEKLFDDVYDSAFNSDVQEAALRLKGDYYSLLKNIYEMKSDCSDAKADIISEYFSRCGD